MPISVTTIPVPVEMQRHEQHEPGVASTNPVRMYAVSASAWRQPRWKRPWPSRRRSVEGAAAVGAVELMVTTLLAAVLRRHEAIRSVLVGLTPGFRASGEAAAAGRSRMTL